MKARGMAVQAVIFDLDGVVIDSEPCYFACWSRAAADLGYVLDEQQYAELVGIPNDQGERILAGMMGEDFLLPEFSRRWGAYWEELLQGGPLPLKTGVLELLDLLDARAVRRAIATSSAQEDVLRCLGPLRARFPVIVCRDHVAQGKPAPDLFLAAAERLLVDPRNCVAIEDSEAGIQAAVAAGMPAILVPDMKPPTPAMAAAAWRVCTSLLEVAPVLFPKTL